MTEQKPTERVLFLDNRLYYLPRPRDVEPVRLQIYQEGDDTAVRQVILETDRRTEFEKYHGDADLLIESLWHPSIDVPSPTGYHPTQALELTIKELTESGQVDYVVIGNNLGGGFQKAAAVAQSMRAERACIVWNQYFSGNERLYATLGFKQFLSRDKLARHLIDYLAQKYKKNKSTQNVKTTN